MGARSRIHIDLGIRGAFKVIDSNDVFEHYCKHPLPDDLQALSGVFRLNLFSGMEWKRGVIDGDFNGDPEISTQTPHALCQIVGFIGCADFEWLDEVKSARAILIPFVIVAKAGEIARCRDALRGLYASDARISLEKTSVSKTLQTAKDLGACEIRACRCPTENFADAARAAQATDSELSLLCLLREVCSGDVGSIAAALRRQGLQPDEPRFLAAGSIPFGSVTMLLGDHKTGKSTLATELAVAVARRDCDWLGFGLNTSKPGFAVYLAGEDSIESFYTRVRLMTGNAPPALLNLVPHSNCDLQSILSALEPDNVSLLVVDPARKYYVGDEDSSDAGNELLSKLEAFAAKKGCAVLLLHHLKRNAVPRNISDVPSHMRGSNVWLDRPRVILGMLRRGNETRLGIPAPNGTPLHNFRQSAMFAGERRLRRDEATHRHVVIDDGSDARRGSPDDGEAARVLAAATQLIRDGQRLTRTGANGLFKRAPAEVAGMSRATIDAAVDSLIARGDLQSDATGALSLSLGS